MTEIRHRAPQPTDVPTAEELLEQGKPWELPSSRISLEAWQFCYMLNRGHFYIEHTFSTLGDQLHVLIGLPYKYLIEEAKAMHLRMRMEVLQVPPKLRHAALVPRG